MSTARARFGELVRQSSLTMAPGVVDPMSARLVEREGFAAVYLTGGGYSRAQGFPDRGLLTMTEITHWVARVVETVDIPVIADADTGYGNALNVTRAVAEFERTGAAAIHLEDQVFPKRCGHYEGKEVVTKEEMVGKIEAAVDARRDQRFLLIARTDARAVHGLDDALDRMHSYLEAGADIGFVEAPRSVEELERIGRELSGRPLLVNIFEGGHTPFVSADQLQAMGYRIAIYPSQAHRAALKATQAALRQLRDSGGAVDPGTLVSFADRELLVGGAEWDAREAKYLSR
jgi:2-methylisocitrate lyase-like PEP mutase family enzyme